MCVTLFTCFLMHVSLETHAAAYGGRRTVNHILLFLTRAVVHSQPSWNQLFSQSESGNIVLCSASLPRRKLLKGSKRFIEKCLSLYWDLWHFTAQFGISANLRHAEISFETLEKTHVKHLRSHSGCWCSEEICNLLLLLISPQTWRKQPTVGIISTDGSIVYCDY